MPEEEMAPPPILYSYVDAGPAAPSPTVRWAIRVQTGQDDPAPTVLAYAVSELVAKNLVMALRRSQRISREQAMESGEWYEAWLDAARKGADGG
jgi:hypothetical protein